MQKSEFFSIPDHTRLLARYWLLIGVVALAIAGLFSLVLVIARTPQLASLPLFVTLFHQALVVHVDLSVLVWFLSIACMLWSMHAGEARSSIAYLEEAALLCFVAGTLAIAFSPLNHHAVPMMSNYIPVLHGPLFFIGLALILCAVGLMLVRVVTAGGASPFSKPMQFALSTAALITLIALVAFFWSYRQMPAVIDGEQYYELLFWGGGHVLQFTHTQIVMVCWLLLMGALKPDFRVSPRWVQMIFSLTFTACLLAPIPYYLYNVTSSQHHLFFTDLMIVANGLVPMLMLVFIAPAFWKAGGNRKTDLRALWSSLGMSLLLFVYGGVLGEMIRGQNVVIPAHYHGSIVAITLAFMGVAYLMLPRFGYRDPAGWRLAYWQPYVYGFGQLLHISGLAWSGGYGVLRKTPGGAEHMEANVKAALGLMGIGGLFAIIGGFMFVIVVGRSVFGKTVTSDPIRQLPLVPV